MSKPFVFPASKSIFAAAVATLAVFAAAGLSACSKSKDSAPSVGSKAAGLPAAPPLSVTARVLAVETMDNAITSTGTVLADEEVDIRSEIQGKVVRIAFKEGARVGKGALLVQLDDAELRAQLIKAKARAKLAKDEEYRMRIQLESEAVSRSEYEQAWNAFAAARAEENLARAQWAKTQLRAPFAGTVGLRHVSVGGFVSPATPITALQAVNPVKIDFSVPGRYAPWIKAGQSIRFTVQGSEAVREAKVYAVEPRIDENTRTLRLRASCPNPDGKLVPGSFAAVHISLEKIAGALLVPAEALTSDARGPKVFLYAGGKALPRPVEAGLRSDSTVQITGGLKEGDTVITSGVVQLRPGAPVVLSGLN